MTYDVRKRGSKFFHVYEDKEEYFIRNNHGNILPVSKVVLMERVGYRFFRKRDTATEENIGTWKKVLPKDEGFEPVEKKDWEAMEAERLKGIAPVPAVASPEDEIEMGPDESKIIAEAEAKAKVEADKIIQDAKARAEAEADVIIKKAETDAKAKVAGAAKKGNK